MTALIVIFGVIVGGTAGAVLSRHATDKISEAAVFFGLMFLIQGIIAFIFDAPILVNLLLNLIF